MNDEISVKDLKAKLDRGDNFILIDCRENEEVALGKISASVHMPMNDIPSRLQELDPDKEYVIQCRSGKRSRKVVDFLKQHDFDKIFNLAGGIMAWQAEIDPNVQV